MAKNRLRWLLLPLFALGLTSASRAQEMSVVKPEQSDDVLINPGIGFITFQRFNGDALNAGTGWTEGMPIHYDAQPHSLDVPGYPRTTIAYLRLYWRFLEPRQGEFDWSLLDKALDTARSRGQTLMLRIAPHGLTEAEDVPAWYRQETGEPLAKNRPPSSWVATTEKWMINPENPAYAREFGGLIRALARRYDGDPRLELVDISILAAWGEGAGSELLSEPTRSALLASYLDSFHKTPLVTQLGDPRTVADTLALSRNAANLPSSSSAPAVGWRADCLGDMGGFDPKRNLMEDSYPEAIVGMHLDNLWQQAPVTMESCWVMQHWKDKGWSLPYIMEQATKWHVSSFNNKSSAVPPEWMPMVNEWLKHMGYRFALRRFAYTPVVAAGGALEFQSWWENKGNAPIYRVFPVALRLTHDGQSSVLRLDGDPRKWLPGDILLNGSVPVGAELRDGTYQLAIAMIDPVSEVPAVHLAIQGTAPDGWYPLGPIELRRDRTQGHSADHSTPKR